MSNLSSAKGVSQYAISCFDLKNTELCPINTTASCPELSAKLTRVALVNPEKVESSGLKKHLPSIPPLEGGM